MTANPSASSKSVESSAIFLLFKTLSGAKKVGPFIIRDCKKDGIAYLLFRIRYAGKWETVFAIDDQGYTYSKGHNTDANFDMLGLNFPEPS